MGVGVCVARTHKRKQPKKLHNFTIIFDVLLYVLRSCNMMRIYACIRRFHFAIAQKKKMLHDGTYVLLPQNIQYNTKK